MPERKSCFLIAPIGDDGSEIRQRSDKILKYVVGPPANEAGYEVVRADKIDKPGIITSQIIQRILESDLVVADLTGGNPNVFYELALRHAIRKPYIQIIAQGERNPFDVAAVRTISVDHTDLDSVDKCKRAIGAQIQALENSPGDVESPVSEAVEIEALKRSAQPTDKYLAEIRETLSRLAQGAEQNQASIKQLTDLVQNQEYTIEQNGLSGTTGIASSWFGGPRILPVRRWSLPRMAEVRAMTSARAPANIEQAETTETRPAAPPHDDGNEQDGG